MMTAFGLKRGIPALTILSLVACSAPPRQSGETASSSTTSAQPSQSPNPSINVPRDTVQQESGDVELSVDQNRYAIGDQIRFTLRSRTSDTLGFNPCNRSLERREGQRWMKYDEPTRMCTMELWLLEPNATRSATTELPATVSVGTYRIVLLLSRQKTAPENAPPDWGTVRAQSESFTVQ